ncbi:MAG: hypothetical protein A2822_00475 [Candidatus Staskawiczbacteria bacterium RIFCSPHIGHO2_01_FULL_41_41]|uniref:Uncharacterized protein n=1 Tax=Candidatus Staskawiczbacteria bacterium RIFCSPHIGHO2_01_FULL_41_41 TaxID=1802203 RepID=A0A1G2HXW0_9BACT|nr:MAG: hypothetical protein A2822_00475 [Candidatus Staskawiczbacteria bacterium RIFCSPHIGHO2_01_FULL_41_41]
MRSTSTEAVVCPIEGSDGRHTWHQVGFEIKPACKCGIVLCGANSPQQGEFYAPCNLPKNHDGPCECTWHPELGTWEKTTPARHETGQLVEV